MHTFICSVGICADPLRLSGPALHGVTNSASYTRTACASCGVAEGKNAGDSSDRKLELRQLCVHSWKPFFNTSTGAGQASEASQASKAKQSELVANRLHITQDKKNAHNTRSTTVHNTC